MSTAFDTRSASTQQNLDRLDNVTAGADLGVLRHIALAAMTVSPLLACAGPDPKRSDSPLNTPASASANFEPGLNNTHADKQRSDSPSTGHTLFSSPNLAPAVSGLSTIRISLGGADNLSWTLYEGSKSESGKVYFIDGSFVVKRGKDGALFDPASNDPSATDFGTLNFGMPLSALAQREEFSGRNPGRLEVGQYVLYARIKSRDGLWTLVDQGPSQSLEHIQAKIDFPLTVEDKTYPQLADFERDFNSGRLSLGITWLIPLNEINFISFLNTLDRNDINSAASTLTQIGGRLLLDQNNFDSFATEIKTRAGRYVFYTDPKMKADLDLSLETTLFKSLEGASFANAENLWASLTSGSTERRQFISEVLKPHIRTIAESVRTFDQAQESAFNSSLDARTTSSATSVSLGAAIGDLTGNLAAGLGWGQTETESFQRQIQNLTASLQTKNLTRDLVTKEWVVKDVKMYLTTSEKLNAAIMQSFYAVEKISKKPLLMQSHVHPLAHQKDANYSDAANLIRQGPPLHDLKITPDCFRIQWSLSLIKELVTPQYPQRIDIALVLSGSGFGNDGHYISLGDFDQAVGRNVVNKETSGSSFIGCTAWGKVHKTPLLTELSGSMEATLDVTGEEDTDWGSPDGKQKVGYQLTSPDGSGARTSLDLSKFESTWRSDMKDRERNAWGRPVPIVTKTLIVSGKNPNGTNEILKWEVELKGSLVYSPPSR
jgi:hypothetical protein